MINFTIKDKNFWKITALIFIILAIVLSSTLLGLLIENKLINTNSSAYFNLSNENEPRIMHEKLKHAVIGNKNANLSIVLYSDFECPFSKKFHKTTYKKLKKEYVNTGIVNIVLKHYPDKLHKNALLEAQAFECAKEQNKRSKIQDELYNHKKLSKTDLLYIAQKSNISIPNFEECLYYQKYKDKILKEKIIAKNKGIQKTPTMLIEEEKIEGVKPYSIIKQIIEEKLKDSS